MPQPHHYKAVLFFEVERFAAILIAHGTSSSSSSHGMINVLQELQEHIMQLM